MNSYSKKRTAQLLLCSLLLESCYNPNLGTSKKTLPAPTYQQELHDKPPSLTWTTPDKHPVNSTHHPRQPQAALKSQPQPRTTTQPLPSPAREAPRQQRVHDKYKRAHQVPNKKVLCLKNQHELLRSPATTQAEQKQQPTNQPAPTTQPRQATPTHPPSLTHQTPPDIAPQPFPAQGGQQVRFIHQAGQWMARVTERIGVFSRLMLLPVVCEGHGDIETALRALQGKPAQYVQRRLQVLRPRQVPYVAQLVYLGELGLKGGMDGEPSGSGEPPEELPRRRHAEIREIHTALIQGNVEEVRSRLETVDIDGRIYADGTTSLHVAALMGHIEVVKFLIEEKDAEIEVTTNDGLTPLHAAAETGRIEIVKFLVEQGAEIEVTTKDDETPLYRAAIKGHIEVVKFLEERGANLEINLLDVPLLHAAAIAGQIEIVRFLVEEQRVSVELTNSIERTPLHAAAIVGHIEIVKFLVAQGAEVNVRDNRLQTPLHLAAEGDHIEVVKFLVAQGAEVNVRDADGQTPLHMATTGAPGMHTEVVAYLISKRAEIDLKATCDLTPLHLASLNGKKEVVKLLVEHGANVKARNLIGGFTPQQIAEQAGHREIVTYFDNHEQTVAFTQALAMNDVARLRQILETGHIRVNTPIDGRCTSLYLAAQKGCREIVETFVENGEEDDLKDAIYQEHYSLSPLYIAVQEGSTEIVKLLLYGRAASNHRRGANREEEIEREAVSDREAAVGNVRDQEGRRLLHVAATKGYERIVRLLVEFMAIAAEQFENSPATPLYQGHVMRELAYVSQVDNYGTTAESLARDAGFTSIANFLKEVKENIEKRRKKLDKDAAVLSGSGGGVSGGFAGASAGVSLSRTYQTQGWAYKRDGLIIETRKIWRDKNNRLWQKLAGNDSEEPMSPDESTNNPQSRGKRRCCCC